MNNQEFLAAIRRSFESFIECGTSRSTAKLKPLHGAIAQDLATKLGKRYEVWSQGYGNDKEASVTGRYVNKNVDITVKRNDNVVAGIGVKFVMQNYSQNSNNYFENMLGETANIRCNNVPYFQIFIILDKLPYYENNGVIKKWETFTDHNISKYVMMSRDNTDVYLHTPTKTLIFVAHVDEAHPQPKNKVQYLNFYHNNDWDIIISTHRYAEFGKAVIMNDYESFLEKVYHAILAQ